MSEDLLKREIELLQRENKLLYHLLKLYKEEIGKPKEILRDWMQSNLRTFRNMKNRP